MPDTIICTDRGTIHSVGLYIVWLTEIIADLPGDANTARSRLSLIRDELIREGTRPVDVVQQEAA